MIPSTTSRPSVLIVDESGDCSDVLRTVLERRGVACLEANEACQGLELARRHHPGVIILDLEATRVVDRSIREGFDTESRQHHTSVVMLGTARQAAGGLPDGQLVTKPYHFGPLVRTIEALLESASAE